MITEASFVFLNTIASEPGAIVGPLAAVLGIIFNFIFELFNNEVTIGVALGLSIFLITFLMRSLILPLGMKSHKSMTKMHRLAPEMDDIKKKYEGKTDPETKRKMQIEIQQLYAKHKVNPLMGCLPALLTLPVFFGLNFIMRQTHLYVNHIGQIYTNISQTIVDAIPIRDAYGARIVENFNFLEELIWPMLPNNVDFHLGSVSDLSRAVGRFTAEQWDAIREFIADPAKVEYLNTLIAEREVVESFLGLNMVSIAGWGWPGIIIPLLSVVTTALSSFLMQRAQRSKDPAQKMQQRIMLFGMPLFLGFITAGMPIGVGIYWVFSNIYQIGQHYILTKYYANKEL